MTLFTYISSSFLRHTPLHPRHNRRHRHPNHRADPYHLPHHEADPNPGHHPQHQADPHCRLLQPLLSQAPP